jgi:hypothetical protein
MTTVGGRRRQPDAGRSGIVLRPQKTWEARLCKRDVLAVALGAAAKFVYPSFDSPALLR